MINFFVKNVIRIVGIVVIITVTCTTSYATIVSSGGDVVSMDDDGRIVAWKQLDHAEIRLTNGLKIAHLTTQTEVNVGEDTEYEETYEIEEPIEILFILDFSQSMETKVVGSNSRRDILISSTEKLIKSLYDKTKGRI